MISIKIQPAPVIQITVMPDGTLNTQTNQPLPLPQIKQMLMGAYDSVVLAQRDHAAKRQPAEVLPDIPARREREPADPDAVVVDLRSTRLN